MPSAAPSLGVWRYLCERAEQELALEARDDAMRLNRDSLNALGCTAGSKSAATQPDACFQCALSIGWSVFAGSAGLQRPLSTLPLGSAGLVSRRRAAAGASAVVATSGIMLKLSWSMAIPTRLNLNMSLMWSASAGPFVLDANQLPQLDRQDRVHLAARRRRSGSQTPSR